MTTITTGVGSPGTINIASGGRTYAYNNISTTPQQVIGANPARQSVTFHNPGTVDIFIAPSYIQNTGSDVALTPSNAALGGCYRVYANGGTTVLTGEVQKPYQAFALSGSTNPLTVTGSNV
jgi:hypothetical protein